MTDPLTAQQEVELEAAVLRRLLRHFDEHKEVQNIELMILAGFCRNCLSKWFVEAASERGLDGRRRQGAREDLRHAVLGVEGATSTARDRGAARALRGGREGQRQAVARRREAGS